MFDISIEFFTKQNQVSKDVFNRDDNKIMIPDAFQLRFVDINVLNRKQRKKVIR